MDRACAVTSYSNTLELIESQDGMSKHSNHVTRQAKNPGKSIFSTFLFARNKFFGAQDVRSYDHYYTYMQPVVKHCVIQQSFLLLSSFLYLLRIFPSVTYRTARIVIFEPKNYLKSVVKIHTKYSPATRLFHSKFDYFCYVIFMATK